MAWWTQILPFFIVRAIAVRFLGRDFRKFHGGHKVVEVEAYDDCFFIVPNCHNCRRGWYRYLSGSQSNRTLRCTKCWHSVPEVIDNGARNEGKEGGDWRCSGQY